MHGIIRRIQKGAFMISNLGANTMKATVGYPVPPCFNVLSAR